MKLDQIRYFMVLCQTLNFARAAERCGVSQPSLTRAVQNLEQELGGLLIRREGRLTHLTKLGELVRPLLQELLEQVTTTRSAAHRFLRADAARLALGVIPSVGPLRLAPFLAWFGRQHPGIEVTLVNGDSARLEELMLAGKLEVALAARLGSGNGRLRHHRLYWETVVAVFPKGHRFERQNAVRVIDLKGENFLLRTDCEKRGLILESCRQLGFQPTIVSRGERDDWIQAMVAAGRGVTVMPEGLHSGYGTLARRLTQPELQRDVSLVTVAGRPQAPSVRHLVRAICAYRWDDQVAMSAHRPPPSAPPPDLDDVDRERNAPIPAAVPTRAAEPHHAAAAALTGK